MGMPPGSLPPQTNGYGPYPPQQQHFSSSNHMPHTDPTPQPGGSSPMPSNSNLAESSAGTPTTVPVPTPVALSEPIPSTSINASLSVLPSSSSAPEVSLAPASTAASPVQPLPTFAPVASSSVAEAGLVSTQEPSESLRESIPASSEPATPADAGDNKTEEPFISSLPPVAQPISSSTTTHAAHPPHSAPPQASTAPPLAMATAGAS